MDSTLNQIRSIADYQFGRGIGEKLFPEDVEVAYSPTTKRIRYVNLGGKRLATLRPTDSLFSLSIFAAERLVEEKAPLRCFVVVRDEVKKFIAEGSDVFAAHVVRVDDVRSKDEVLVIDENNHVLAVGRALLCGAEMQFFKVGVAVKVRHGCDNNG
ncbi:MAG: pseudouridine synthase [Candidatus Bathyarchaeota archaeon]|nr:pseudouridine synthase [Candidatus Bathyarchaeota archaeon]